MMLTVEHNGRKTINITAPEAVEMGYPDEVIAAAETKWLTSKVSVECKRRIYAVASPETQMNMAAATAVISAKTASARSSQEQAVLAGLEASIGWVNVMRGNIATLVGDQSLDIADDANWPAVPTEVIALVDQF